MVIAAVAVLVIFGGLYVWRATKSAAAPREAPPAVAVIATIVKPTDVPATLEAVGSVRAVREVMLAPEVAGRVVGIKFEAGSRVGAGALLVQLYDPPERAARRAAKARAAFAGVPLPRSQALPPKIGTPPCRATVCTDVYISVGALQ